MSFQTLLKAAAVADGDGPQTRQRLDHIAVENYQIEVNDRFDRDVSEDAAVGARIAATDGIRREQARQPGSIVESYQVADADVLGPAGEIEAY
jgi:ornithine decarboxylase